MLAFFRRLTKSKIGLIIVFAFLAMIAFAFAAGDVSNIRSQGMGTVAGADGLVSVGDKQVTGAEFGQRVQGEMEAYRQQQPTLDMAQFIAGGGFDASLTRLTSGLALEEFARTQGMVVSKRAIDGQIASLPGLQGPNGQFDPTIFRQLLAQRNLTEKGVREDIARDALATALTGRLVERQPVPLQLAMPYANLSLERRAGVIAFVPTSAAPAGPVPTAAELQTFYSRNLARYTIPERRQFRFARVTLDQVRAAAVPTEAEIAQAYATDRARYAPTERRTITQVVVLDKAGADRLAARVRSGTPLVQAATAAGLTSSTKTSLTKAALASETSPALADAVFAASKGAVVGPVRGGIGFAVAAVEDVRQVAGRSLAQARDEIAAALTTRKTADALEAQRDAIEDALGDNATFDELIKDRNLQAQTSPALIASGVDPDRPAAPDAALAPLVQAAFDMNEGDDPQLVQTGEDGSFAVVALARIIPAAPRALAAIREQVSRDLAGDRARIAARRIAQQLLARVNGGASMQQAWAASGLRTDGPKPLVASREDMDRQQGPGRAPLALMFAMAPGTAKLLEAPSNGGWAVVKLERIQPGDSSRDQPRVAAIRQAFGQLIGREYAEQFARAAQKVVGSTTDKAAVDRLKKQLTGQGAAGN